MSKPLERHLCFNLNQITMIKRVQLQQQQKLENIFIFSVLHDMIELISFAISQAFIPVGIHTIISFESFKLLYCSF